MNSLPMELVQMIANKMDIKTKVRFSVTSTEIEWYTYGMVRTAVGCKHIRRAIIHFDKKKVICQKKKTETYRLLDSIFVYRDVWVNQHKFKCHLGKIVLPMLLRASWMPLPKREKYCICFIQTNLVFCNRPELTLNQKLRMLMYPSSDDKVNTIHCKQLLSLT